MYILWSILFFYVAKFAIVEGRAEGYHFTRFSGPVSGPVRQVEIAKTPYQHVNGQEASVDYVAKPDYSFAYGVQDPESGNYQNQRETRDGDVVKGEYSVVDADGTTRKVVYTADPRNGFQATVHLSEPNKQHAIRQQNYVKTLNENSLNDNDNHHRYY